MSATQRALDRTALLVGIGGEDSLKEALETFFGDGQPTSEEELYTFIDKFREIRGLRDDTIDPVIDLLEAGGVSRNRAAKEIMSNMVNLMRQKISSLSQQQIQVLLDNSYSYLTVPELAPVAVCALENLKDVRADLWSEIVNHGLDEAPYASLPLSIKRRIWNHESTAFEHELDLLVKRLPEVGAPAIESISSRPPYDMRRRENPTLKELNQMVYGMGENITNVVAEKLFDKARVEPSPGKRTAIANLFQDFIQGAPPPRRSNALAQVKRLARAIDRPLTAPLESKILQEFRDALSAVSAFPLVMLLTASSYTRDFFADHLVHRLVALAPKMKQGTGDDLVKASKIIENDIDLQNLTHACLFAIRVGAIMSDQALLQDAEIELPFMDLYPVLLTEIHRDQVWAKDEYFNDNVELPNNDLKELLNRGCLERRVVTTYCMQLMMLQNIMGTCRFHLLLDSITPLIENEEEVRESVIVREVCEFVAKASDRM